MINKQTMMFKIERMAKLFDEVKDGNASLKTVPSNDVNKKDRPKAINEMMSAYINRRHFCRLLFINERDTSSLRKLFVYIIERCL